MQQQAMMEQQRRQQRLVNDPSMNRGQAAAQAEFRDVNLDGSDSGLEEIRGKKGKAKGIKKEKGAGGNEPGFFGKLFGCCTSKKAPQADVNVKRPEIKRKEEKKA